MSGVFQAPLYVKRSCRDQDKGLEDSTEPGAAENANN